MLAQRPDNALLLLRRGRLLHMQGRAVESLACYERSLALGMEPARVVPYQAELLFDRREFAKAQALMRSLDIEQALPRLKPSIRYWSAS